MSKFVPNVNKPALDMLDIDKIEEFDPAGDPLVLEHLYQINWREFACGWSAAFVNITITYPINKVIFRQVFAL